MKLATWNINSVRLRMPIVERFVLQHQPDVLCLQETKCRDSEFPSADLHRLGYEHLAINGQKGYHGVCVASRFPISKIDRHDLCGVGDARHVAVELQVAVAGATSVTVHNFYVPAGGDEPDPKINPKFAHKLSYLDEMAMCLAVDQRGSGHQIVVGDLNVAPLETDVWNHKALLKIVSHTPIEVEKFTRAQASGQWVDAMRQFIPPEEKVYSWWSYRSPNWEIADKGRRLDHIWTSQGLAPALAGIEIVKEARGWDRPSDHVPVIVRFVTTPNP